MTEKQCERHPKAVVDGVECPECAKEPGVIYTKGPVYKCDPSDRLVFVDASESDVSVEYLPGIRVTKTDPSPHIVTVKGPLDFGVSHLTRPLITWPHDADWVNVPLSPLDIEKNPMTEDAFLKFLEKICPGDDAHDGLGDPRPLLERCEECVSIYNAHQDAMRTRGLILETDLMRGRERALRDACQDVCMYCGKRALGYGEAEGPNDAGNHIHRDTSVTTKERTVLCMASAIWHRIRWESRERGRNT